MNHLAKTMRDVEAQSEHKRSTALTSAACYARKFYALYWIFRSVNGNASMPRSAALGGGMLSCAEGGGTGSPGLAFQPALALDTSGQIRNGGNIQ
jgi:hypothetical protein